MWRQGYDNIIILCCLILFKVVTAGEVGEKCSPTEEISKGTCKLITDCKDALSFIRSKGFPPFSRCGFKGNMEIVCCPDNYIQPPTPTKGPRSNTGIIGQEKYVGEKCSPTEEISKGTCKLLTDCKDAVSFIRSKGFPPFSRCGFKGNMEIVCCPDNYIQPPTPTKGPRSNTGIIGQEKYGSGDRIADKECQKIVASTLPPLGSHIIGGKNASLGEFAYMVSLGYNISGEYGFLCGGSLISDSYVITAAHCVDTLKLLPVMVRMGVIYIGDTQWNNESDVRIEKIINHPDRKKPFKYNDLSLLKLEHPVVFSPTLSPICLYTKNEDPSVSLTIIGWGRTNTTRYEVTSPYLQKASVVVVSKSKCEEAYPAQRRLPRGITGEQICAGDPMGLRDTCQGDSGGPLLGLTSPDGFPRLVGVTSFGRSCGSPLPGVYTRVSRYLDWIESVVWPTQA